VHFLAAAASLASAFQHFLFVIPSSDQPYASSGTPLATFIACYSPALDPKSSPGEVLHTWRNPFPLRLVLIHTQPDSFLQYPAHSPTSTAQRDWGMGLPAGHSASTCVKTLKRGPSTLDGPRFQPASTSQCYQNLPF
jgi:hypothetical protein